LKQKFASLFRGFWKLQGEYEIKLREDAQRRVALPYLEEVKGELHRIDISGAISPVDESTDWC
jgi:hypothetical protein